MSAFEYHGSVTVGNGESESESGVPFASEAIIRSVVDAGTNEQIHVDSQELVFIGNYSREADDLLIENGSVTVVFINYFANPSQPDLIAPNGAKITFKTASALAGPASPGQYAQAGSATGEPLQIGEVLQLDGKATATHTNGVQKTLNVGDPVFQGDVLETGSDTSLGISFLDETVFSVSANAKMVLDELIYNPKEAEKSSMTFNLVEGTFVFAAGKIAPSGSMNIETPIATMGIRGTTPKVSVSTEFGTGEFALLPDPGTGKIGSYVLINRDTGQIIGRVNSVDKKWVVTSLSNEAVEIGKSTADLLEDNQAIDDIQTVFSISIGERSSLEGTATFQQVSVTSISALSDQADDAIVVTDTSTGGRQVGIIDNPNVDDPPVAVDDEFDTGEDTLITGRNVIDNPVPGTDFDPEGYPVTVQAVNGTPLDFSNGSVSILLPSGAILVIAPNGDFTYDPNNAYEFLGLNDQDIDSFKYTIVDAGGFTDTATVEITHTGKNDQPAITQTATTVHSGAFTEDTDTGSVVSRTVLGNVTFSDTDASDTHTTNAGIPTVTWNQDNGNQVSLAPVGTMAVTLSEDAPDTNPVLVFDATGNLVSRPAPIEGTANWQYSVTESDIDFLGVGETLTLVFPITITDDSGVGSGSGTNEPASVTQNVTITVTGTNDVMVVGATDLVGAVTEDVAVTSGDLTDTGTLAFDDVDLSDVHTASAAFKTTTHGGGQLGTLTASVTTDTTGTGTGGIITWDFAVATADVQFLGAGDTITETYTITFTDNEGDTQTRDVDVTITGTNDVMVVGATDLVGAVTEDVAVTSGDLTDTGTLAFDDVDLSDVHTASAAFKTTTHGGGQLGILTASVTTDTTGTGTGGIITWDFAVATADVQFLGAGDTITETYTITFTDNEGDTQTRDVDVTITGTNDVMVVGATDLVGAVAEDVAVTSGDLTDTGTLAFDDVDLSDVHTASAAFKTTDHGGGQLGTLTASVTTDTTGTGTGGIITWDFAVATADVQFLGAGDTITETYTITFTDNEGDTQTRDVDVTVTGTNDVMVVGATDLVGAVTEDVAVTSGDLTDTGTLAFDDVDLSDVHTASAAFKTTDHGGGQLGTLTASVTTDTTGTGTGGIITWDFAVATADVQFLGAGDTITETYTITFTDNEGDTQTRDVDVTVTGTNDVMVVGATDLVGAVTEDVAVTSGDLTDTGTLAFDDVDLSDVHTASAAFKTTDHGGGQLGTLTASVTTDTTGTGTGGIITWDFAVATADVQFLGAGDTITETYTITFTDNEGDTQTRDVDVTVTGTNDVMVVGATDLVGAVTEDVAVTSGDLTDTGTLAFDDVDLSDVHTASAAFKTTDHGGGQLGTLTASVTTDTTGTGTGGIITWDFAVATADVQFLGAGDTITETYTITFTDNEGDTQTRDVDVTVTGTNDVMVVGATDLVGAVTEDVAVTSGDLTDTGTLAFDDVDLSDVHTASAAFKTTTHGGGQLGTLTASVTTDTTGTGTGGIITWDFAVATADVQFLGAGDTITETYTITFTDNEGDTQTRDVDVTITGTNDVMVVGATDLVGAVAEDVAVTSGDLTDTGTLAFDDVDLSDVHTASAAFKTTDHGGGQLGILTASVTTDTTGTGTGGIITWDFAVATADVQFLGAGDTITETYTITFTDNEGDTQTRDVDVTITGTNDVMVVGATDLVGAVTEDVAVTSGDLTDTGTLAFDDVDLSDVHTASAAFKTTTHGGGQLGTLTASVTTDTTGTGTGGIITWDFAVATADVQFLGAGDTITETYTITFTDNEGDTQTRDVDVTVTGTNDVMVVGATDLVGAVAEDVAVTSGDLTDTGTLAFDDVDLSDVHTASAAFKTTDHGGGQLGTLTASVTTDTTGTGTGGIITWDFAVATADVQFLGAGDTITETYTITFTDNEGDTQTRDVDVTITGTNDVMVVGATDLVGAVAEDVAVTSGDLTDTGTLAFDDVDLSDVHTASAAFKTTDHGGGQLGTLTASVTTDTTGTGTGGIITWDFAVATADVQFLGAGDTITETYTITFTDNEGDTQTRDVDVTVTGTNDVMVVGATDLVGAVTEDVAVTSGDLTDTGTLAFDDVDLSDVHTASAAFKTTTHGGGQLGTLTASVTTDTTGTGTGGIITWDFAVATADVQFLGAGDTITETYTITFTDNEGDTQTRDVDVTITGTNDVMVVGATDLVGAVTEDVAVTSGDLTDTGTLAFDDVDLSDVHTASAAFKTTDHGGGQLGTLTASVTTDTTGTGTGGIITWDFAVATADVQFLGAGDTITETYTITFTDNEGDTQTRDVDVTVTGTNDVPELATVLTGSVTEDANNTATEKVTGAISFADVDVTDTHTVTASYNNDATWSAGIIPSAVLTALEAAFSVTNSEWTFEIAQTDLQGIGEGETTTLSFDVTVTDDSGAANNTDTQTVTITITGSNDAPELTVDSTGSITEDATTPDLSANGSVTINDIDGADTHTVTALLNGTPNWSGGSLSSAQITALTSGTFDVSTPGQWDYTISNSEVQFLAAGETIDVKFDVTVTDDSGAANNSDTETVTITINGVNDAPTVTTLADPVAINEGNTGITTNVEFVIANFFTASDVDSGETPSVDEGNVFITANTNSDTTNAAPFVVQGTGNGTKVVVETGNYDSLNAGETGIFDVTYNVVSGSDTVTESFTITINGHNDAPQVTAISAGTVTEDDAVQTIDLLAGGQTDIDSNTTLSATNISAQDNLGNAVVFTNNNDGTIDIDPNQFGVALNTGDSRTVTVSYDVSDGTTGTANTATLVVDGVDDNTAPVANNDSLDELPDVLILAADYHLEYVGTNNDRLTSAQTGLASLGVFDSVDILDARNGQPGASPTLAAFDGYETVLTWSNVAFANATLIGNLLKQYVDGGGGLVTAAHAHDAVSGLAGNITAALPLGSGTSNGATGNLVAQLPGDAIFSGINIATFNTEQNYFTGSAPLAGGATLLATTFTNSNVIARNADGDIISALFYPGFLSSQTETANLFGNMLLDVAAPTTFTGEDTSQIIQASTLLANDNDADGHSISITAVNATSTEGASVTLATGGGTISYDPTTAANIQALAAGQTLTDTFTYTISDGNGGNGTATVTLTVEGHNDAPVVSAGGTLNFQHGIGAQRIEPTLSATDVDTNDQMTGATVTIQGFTSGDGDLLSFVNQNGITGSYDNTTGVLTLNGSATAAQYQSALASVTYNTSDLPATAETRTIEWVLNDGDANSATVTSTINIPAINEVLGAVAFTGSNGNDVLTGSNLVDDINGLDGDDIVFGSNADDLLTGGAGSDVFVLSSGSTDTILDFDVLNDYIDIAGVVDPAFDPNNPDADLTFSMNGSTLVLNIDDGSGGTESVIFGGASPPSNGDNINVVFDPTAEALQVQVGLGII